MKMLIIIILIALVGGSVAVSRYRIITQFLLLNFFSLFIRYQYNQKIYLTIFHITSLQNGFQVSLKTALEANYFSVKGLR